MNSTNAGLRCDSVTKLFSGGRAGVHNVSLVVVPGSILALVGGNGAGKTTIMNLCLGFLPPDSGDIFIDGISMRDDQISAKLRVAYVPEVARLYNNRSALQNLRFFNSLIRSRPRNDEAEAILQSLGFPAHAVNQHASTYSKGMRQKVVIAIGLMKGADVFLLDEPTSGLDPRSRTEFSGVMERLRGDGKAILFSSHDLASVHDVADNAVVLREGKIVLACAGRDLKGVDLDAVAGVPAYA